MFGRLLKRLERKVTLLDAVQDMEAATEAGAVSAYRALRTVSKYFEQNSVTVSVDLKAEMVVICPDCGKGVAFRNRCPKCYGASWVPAGLGGGIHHQQKAKRWREHLDAASAAPEVEGNVVEFPVTKEVDEYESMVDNAGALA